MTRLPSSREDQTIGRVADALALVPAVRLTTPERWRTAAIEGDRPARRAAGSLSIRRFTPGRLVLLAVGLAGIVVAALIVLPGSPGKPAEALAVFDRPAVDARHIRAATPTLAQAAAHYADARAIATPTGTGYVMHAADGRVCLAVPDPADGWGQSCATPEQIEQRGLVVGLAPREGHSGSAELVAVLPDSVSDVTLHRADGTSAPLDVTDGYLAVSMANPGSATVSYRIGDQDLSIPLAPHARCFMNGDTGLSKPAAASRTRALRQALGIPPCDERGDPGSSPAGGAP